MYEVYKHPAPFNGKKWAVKLPHGIECYKTKRKAEEVAAQAAESEAEKTGFGLVCGTAEVLADVGLTPINWDDPTERLALIERVGHSEYSRLLKAFLAENPIRATLTRFGLLYAVSGTGQAFATRTQAEHVWMEAVLANDEASTDQELQAHFTKNGVAADVASSYIERRTAYLNGSVVKG